MRGSHAWRADSAVFDEENLVSHAGLVPVLELGEQAGLSGLLDEHVRFACERVKSGAANPTAKLGSVFQSLAGSALCACVGSRCGNAKLPDWMLAWWR